MWRIRIFPVVLQRLSTSKRCDLGSFISASPPPLFIILARRSHRFGRCTSTSDRQCRQESISSIAVFHLCLYRRAPRGVSTPRDVRNRAIKTVRALRPHDSDLASVTIPTPTPSTFNTNGPYTFRITYIAAYHTQSLFCSKLTATSNAANEDQLCCPGWDYTRLVDALVSLLVLNNTICSVRVLGIPENC